MTRAERKAVRAEVVRVAEQTGARAYQFQWDGDQKVQITGFPPSQPGKRGKATIEKVTTQGLSVEPRRLLLAAGVPARWVGVGTAVLALAAEVARVVLT